MRLASGNVLLLPTVPIQAPPISAMADPAEFHRVNGLLLRNTRVANTALQTLVSRRTSPHDTAVLSIGQFHAGTSDIVIPETVELCGTIRTLLPATHDHLAALFHQLVEGLAATYGVRLELV